LATSRSFSTSQTRTGGVEDLEPARRRFLADRLRNAVRAEDHYRIVRNVGKGFDEDRAAGFEPVDDVAVVHDFVADINRGAETLQCLFDDRDRPVDTGTEATWIGKERNGGSMGRCSHVSRLR
jgi:hypothetical protein